MTVHVTIEMDEAVKADLDGLALNRGLAVDDVLAEAVEAYIGDQKALLAAIDEGLAELDAGLGIPHEEVVAWLHARREDWGH